MNTLKFPLLPSLLLLLSAQAAWADFGCHFVVRSKTSLALDSSEKKISFRFTCPKDMNLTGASFYCEKTQRPPAYRLSLREDERGSPAKTLGTSRITPKGAGWNTASFSDLPLYGGKIYHLVIEYDTHRGGTHAVGTIGPRNFASISCTSPLNPFNPRDERPDPGANVLASEGNRWKALDLQPLYALHGSGLQSQGNPYDDFGELPIHGNGTPQDASDDVLQGEALHPHGGVDPKGLLLRVRKQGNPTGPLNYRVYRIDHLNHTTNLVFAGRALDSDQVPRSFQWVTIGFGPKDHPQSFPPECRSVVFQTDSGRSSAGTSACDDCYLLSAVGNSGGLGSGDDLGFDGGAHLSRAVSSQDGWTTWTDDFERDANVVILGPYKRIELSPVPPIPTPIPWVNGMIP